MKCEVCQEEYVGHHDCVDKKRDTKQDSEVGSLGFGFDPSCGTIEPTINLGGGLGIGFDGHLTIGGF